MIKGSSTTLTELSPVSSYALNDRGRSFQGLYTTAKSNDFANKTYLLKYGHLFRGYAPIGTRFATIEKHRSPSGSANDNSPHQKQPSHCQQQAQNSWLNRALRAPLCIEAVSHSSRGNLSFRTKRSDIPLAMDVL